MRESERTVWNVHGDAPLFPPLPFDSSKSTVERKVRVKTSVLTLGNIWCINVARAFVATLDVYDRLVIVKPDGTCLTNED